MKEGAIPQKEDAGSAARILFPILATQDGRSGLSPIYRFRKQVFRGCLYPLE